MLSVWAQFGMCALLIAVAGRQLLHYGDAIAGETGLSGNWTGMLVPASVTPAAAIGHVSGVLLPTPLPGAL